MPDAREHRQLLAIMFTDVVGYTALTERSEAAAVRVRSQHRDLVRTLVAQFEGEVIDATGDESLSIFPSALRAVDCALALQGALRSHADMRLRIGIHLGDVIRRGREVVGEGVNVAARIRPLAQPGGICVSEPVYQMVRSRTHVKAQALGPQLFKNVTAPVAVYTLAASESGTAQPRARHKRMLWAAVAGVLLIAAVIAVKRNAILAWIALTAPRYLGHPIEQKVGFAQTNVMVEWLNPKASDLDRRVLGEFLRRSGSGAAVAGFMRAQLQIDVSEQARRISVPTLVLHARDDHPVPIEAGRALAALIPNVRFEIVEGGHLEGTGSTPEVRARIIRFFDEEPSPPFVAAPQ